jgi:hypothetical protein
MRSPSAKILGRNLRATSRSAISGMAPPLRFDQITDNSNQLLFVLSASTSKLMQFTV